MANAGKHGMHPGSQGKGSGSGAMTELPEGVIEDNAVLSNRDKAQHGDERGLEGLSEIPCLGGGLHIRPPWPG